MQIPPFKYTERNHHQQCSTIHLHYIGPLQLKLTPKKGGVSSQYLIIKYQKMISTPFFNHPTETPPLVPLKKVVASLKYQKYVVRVLSIN